MAMELARNKSKHAPPRSRSPLAALWFAALAGPAAWATHMSAASWLAPLLCQPLMARWFYAATCLALALAAVGGYMAWRCYRRLPVGAPASAEIIRARYFSLVGIFTSVIAAFGVLANAISMQMSLSC